MSETQHNPVEFSTDLLGKVQDIGQVLVKLMDDQINAIQAKIGKEGKVEDFLELFVTLDGTKQPVSRKEIDERVSETVAEICLEDLKNSRILRETDMGIYELAHDTLAARLATRRTVSTPTAILDMVSQVKKKYEDHREAEKKRFGYDFLNVATLQRYAVYEEEINRKNLLDPPHREYLEKSKSYRRRIKRIRKWTFWGMVGLSVALLITLGLIANQINVINTAKKGAEDLSKGLQEAISNLKFERKRTTTLANSNKLTSEGAQLSKSDRKLAFIKYSQALDSLHQSELLSENELAQRLLNELMAELSISPFYLYEKKVQDRLESVTQVIAEDSLQFCLGIRQGDNNIYFWAFKDSLSRELDSTLIGDQKLLGDTMNASIQRILFYQNEKKIVFGDESGKVWTLSLSDLKDLKQIYDFERPITCLEKFQKGSVLVGVDSLIYSLYLDGRKFPAKHEIGFDRHVQLIVPNPLNDKKFAVVKVSSHEILLCEKAGARSRIDTILKSIYTEPVSCLAYSPDGKKMAAGFEGEVAMVWEVKYPQILTELRGHRSLISAIKFSPDGETILSCSLDKAAILWNNKGDIINKLYGHQGGINSVDLTRNNYALTASEDGAVKAWDLNPLSKEKLALPNEVLSLAVSPSETKLAVSFRGGKGFFYLWDWESGKLDTIWQPRKIKSDEKGEITALAFTPDGKKIVAGSVNQLTTVIDLSGNEEHEDYRSGFGKKIPRIFRIQSVDVNEEYVLIGASLRKDKHAALVINRRDPKDVQPLYHTAMINGVKFSPDGQTVLTSCENGRAYLWDRSTGERIDQLTKHRTSVTAVDFSADGNFILTGSTDNTAYLWKKDSTSGKFQALGKGCRSHGSDIVDVDISPDTSENTIRFITASTDKTVKIWTWDEKNGFKERPSIIRHLEGISQAKVYFQEGLSLVASGSDDRTVRIWKTGSIADLIRERGAFATK